MYFQNKLSFFCHCRNTYATNCNPATDGVGGPSCPSGQHGGCCEATTIDQGRNVGTFCQTLNGPVGTSAPEKYNTCSKAGGEPYCCQRYSAAHCSKSDPGVVCPGDQVG